MKHIYKSIFAMLLVSCMAGKQTHKWRWGRASDFERIDTTVRIPRNIGNSIYISDNDFYLRFGF